MVRTHCLIYLISSHWTSGANERTRYDVRRTLQLANAAKMPEHIAAAQANLAWLAWRERGISSR